MQANDGRVVDITDLYREGLRWDIEASAAGAEMEELLAMHANDRRFRVYCGGCPFACDTWVSTALLEDTAFSAGNAWVRIVGFQAHPLRCPYCTGEMQRPADPAATPYPVAEEADRGPDL